MHFGYTVEEALSKLDRRDKEDVRERCKTFLVILCSELQKRLPKQITFLKAMVKLSPEIATSQVKPTLVDILQNVQRAEVYGYKSQSSEDDDEDEVLGCRDDPYPDFDINKALDKVEDCADRFSLEELKSVLESNSSNRSMFAPCSNIAAPESSKLKKTQKNISSNKDCGIGLKSHTAGPRKRSASKSHLREQITTRKLPRKMASSYKNPPMRNMTLPPLARAASPPPPARVTTPPTREVTPPARVKTPLTREVTPPARVTTLLIREVAPPSREVTLPARVKTPLIREVTPLIREVTSPARVTKPATGEPPPPAIQVTPPVREATPPARETTSPSRETTSPAKETKPPAREPTPPAREVIPLVHQETLQELMTKTRNWSGEVSNIPQKSFDKKLQTTKEYNNRSLPLDSFLDMFPNHIFSTIAENTNKYAEHMFSFNWKPTDTIEVRAILGMIILMGVHPLSRIDLYWSSDQLFYNPVIAKVMSCKRFKKLTENLHLNDKAAEVPRGHPNYEKLCERSDERLKWNFFRELHPKQQSFYR
ncbi:unnamed protein product [Parnassius apollo]|uniref:(apollo) hypothetical protein n=1 Tax=Parnassius apollo TaxID=110799 RepID=A0A8S3XKT8_PARAO|nr:unnamed protein product [Parnassius apollo]